MNLFAAIRMSRLVVPIVEGQGGGWHRGRKEDPEGMAAFVKQKMPLGRFETSEEVADFVAFLASERASLITGACIPADGCQGHSMI